MIKLFRSRQEYSATPMNFPILPTYTVELFDVVVLLLLYPTQYPTPTISYSYNISTTEIRVTLRSTSTIYRANPKTEKNLQSNFRSLWIYSDRGGLVFPRETVTLEWRTPRRQPKKKNTATTLYMQHKMTNTMTMQEQIEMSGLEIMSSLSTSSSSSSQLQWNSTNQWSPLLGGGQEAQACMTIVSGSGENDAAGPTIVVIGGRMQRVRCTNSVIVWDPSTKRWRNGPSLNDRRHDLVAVVCRDQVYAIGGFSGDNSDFLDNYTTLDTIESIQVSSLLEMTETTTTTRQNNNQWTRLQCRLLSPRRECAAVVVHNRYIVILGGFNAMYQVLSSVDIIDTAPPHNNNNNGEPTIVAGPSMNSARYAFGAAVVDNRIFVVAGSVDDVMQLPSVESLLFQQQPQDKDKDHTNSNSNVTCIFPNSSWRMEPHLSLSSPRDSHAVAKMGSCLVVAGGCTKSVEVLDVQQGVVWSLPNVNIQRPFGCSMVTLSDCLLVLGGNYSEDCVESLALTVYQKHERCYKFLKFLIEIEFLGRPTRK